MADNPYLRLVNDDMKVGAAPEPAANENPYAELARQDLDQAKQKIKGVLDVVSPVNPDQAAEALKLSRSSGLPEQTVQDNLDEVRRKERLRLLNMQQIMADSPILARQLLDPNFAKISHDDVEHTSAIESAVRYLVSAPGERSTLLGDIGAGAYEASRGAAGVFKAATELVAPVLDPLTGTILPENPLRRVAEGFGQMGLNAKRSAEALSPPTNGVWSGGVSSGVKSLSQNLLGLPMAFFPGGQGAYLTYMSAGAGGQSYLEARESGLSPVQSLPFAASQGLIEFATEKIPVGALLGDIKAGAPIWKALAHQLATEIPGEQVATVLQDLNDWAVLHPDRPFSEYLAARPDAALQTAIATVIGVGGNVAVSKGLESVIGTSGIADQKAQQANQVFALLSQLNEMSAASKVRERDVESFANFLQAVENERGAPATTLYIEPKTLVETLTAAGADINQVMSSVPSLANLDEQAQTGTMVAIPVSDFAAHIAGSDYAQAIMPHLRDDPNGMSKVEADDYMQNHGDKLKAEVEKVLAEKNDDAQFRTSMDKVKADIAAQIKGTQRFTDDVNEAYATLMSTFYAVTGAKLGMSPEQMAAKYPIKIQASSVTGGDQYDQGGNLKTDTPKFRNWFQQSKAVDVNGKPMVMYHGTGQDIAAFKAKQAGAIFVTSKPSFAAEFSDMSFDWMVGNYQKVLTPEQIEKAYAKAEETIRAELKYKEVADREVEKIREGKATGIAYDALRNALVAQMPSGQNVMPLYVSVQNPFDYENPEHVAAVVAELNKSTDQWGNPRGDRAKGFIEHGNWEEIEKDTTQAAIKAAGFDGFYVKEGKEKNLAVYDPAQIKSVFNNGEFDANNPNILNQDSEQAQLNESEDAKEDALSDDVAEITQADVPESVDAASVLDNALKIAKSQVWAKGRDLKLAIQEAVQQAAQAAGVDVGAPSPQTTEYLVRAGVKDALMALQQNANAIGWYDVKTRQALAVMALVHPEIAKDQNARFAFVWALAVTSNGMKVGKNFELAEQAYEFYKKNGRMPTNIQAGQAQKAINESLELFNELREAWGIDDLRRFMLTNFTVGEIAAINKELKPGGEHAATFVKGAAILGPKIGNGFFSNLYGNFDQLTMDRWLVRTWGRWTGTLIKPMPHQTELARARLTKARDAVAGDERLAGIIGTPITKDTPVDDLAIKVQEASTDPALRAQMNETEAGLELRKAGNSLAKYLDGQKEAPAGPNERNYIRQVFSEMLGELQQRPEYKDLTMADLQAVLWYAEKRLYETAKEENDEDSATEGYNDEDAPDYANAAADVARAKGVSDRKIQNALKKEEQHGRTGDARPADSQEAAQGERQQGQAAGFTRGQKRLFIGTQAVHRARSNRTGDQGQSFAYARKSSGNGGEAGLLKPKSKKTLGITYTAEWKPGRSLGTIFRANGITTPTFYELAQGDEKNAQRFADAITESKQASGAVGAAVYVYPVEDYKGMRLFLADDGKSGVAVKPDGDIVSVFSNGGAGRSVMELAIAAGGTKLDAFDTILPQFYSAHGFVATSRLTWDDSQAPDGWDKKAMGDFNGGEPDVVFMVLDKSYQGMYSRKDGKRFEGDNSYDKAVDTQTRAQKKLRATNAQYNQDEQGPRGQISFGQDITQTPSVITLLNAANLSTFLHESGHFFLEVTADIAGRADAPQEIRDDMQTVLNWFGVPDLSTWQGMDIEAKRPYHEKFARGFETYLFEGNSPSLEMQGIFQRFRSWLVNIYKQITSLGVQLDDEIRGVFDRMLASSEAIRQAEQARSFKPMFETKPAFMSDDEWREYQQTDVQSAQDAVQYLEQRSLRDMQWMSNAKARLVKQLQKDAAEKRKEVRREVEAEVMAQPVYRAREFFKRGMLDGQPVDTPVKLSIPEIEAMYEGNPILGMIKSELGFGKYGMLGTENGMHPNQAAELFGFSSADHLIRALLGAPDPRGIIEQQTDQRMLERYGDINSPQALSRIADEAIHNDARARFVATEANALAKATGKPRIVTAAAKQFANEIINRLKIRNIRPGQYAASAARAGREAAQSKDLIEAATLKRNQLINTYATKAAYEAQQEVIKAVRYLRKFDNKNIAKVVHPDYLEQIWALLDRFDLRTATSLKEIDKRRALVQWVEAERAKGNEPVVPQELLDEAYRISYKEMTLEDFRGLIDTIRNIEHLGRLKDKLLRIQDQREFKAVSGEAGETIRENATKDIPQQLEKKGIKNAVVSGGREVLAWHRKFASLIRQMDGFKDGGFLWQTFTRPMNEAGTKEASMREQATVKLAELYKGLGKVNLNKTEFIPEIGASLSLEGRLAIALNMGNETNMRRVMEGEGWNAAQVNAIVGSLTREQWNFVQGVWDYLNSYWPEIAAKERRMTGLVPEKVESRPFVVTLADGTQMSLAGGYYPIKYNSDRSSKAEADTAAEVLKQMERGLYARAQTARGHLEARVESVGRPMRYDLGVIDQHLNQVIHDLSWHEYLVDANRLLRSDPVDSAIREHYGPEVLRTMRGMLEDIAIGELPAQGVIENAVRWVRAGSSIAAMGWSFLTAVQQPLGLSQSMVRIGPKWVAQGMGRWLRDAASFESTVGWIAERSEFMRLRAKTQQREIAEIRNTLYKGETMSAVEGSFFYLITKMQLVADVPTWIGMYEKAMAEGADEPRAIALADQAVLDSQGGGQVKDLAKIQRGGEWQKLWTNFYSYFNVTYNLLAESVGETRKVGASRLPLLAADFLMLTVVPATLATLIKSALKGDDDDPDKLAKKIVAENVSYLLGLMVGTREIGAAVAGTMGYEGPSGARFFADIGKFAKQVEQGEADEAFWRSANELGGIVLHYPASQVDRTVRGIIDLAEGRSENPLAPLVGPAPKR